MLSRRLHWMAAAVVAAGSGCAGANRAQRVEYTRLCMGVEARIVLYADDAAHAQAAARRAFQRLARLEAITSDYRVDSEISRLAGAAGGEAIAVSDDLVNLLSVASEIARDSGGAFDVTVGPVVDLWRGARRAGALPDKSEISRAGPLVDWRGVEVDAEAKTARLRIPGMKLDLGGIAKGYAAQQAVELLRSQGIERCLVALAGDVVAGDPPPGQSGWTVETPSGMISLSNMAVSTSGDSQHFIELDGVRYSHIVDPRTGRALTSSVEVTVIATRGELADALASACCVLGPGEGAALVRRHPGAEAVFH